MTRLSLVLLLALLAAPAAARADDAPDLGVDVASCTRTAATFEGSMPSVDGADRLGMRFTLQVRTDDDPFAVLKVPGFGSMQKSRGGVGGYVLDRKVTRLLPGMDYRMVVDFRWYDADGDVVKRAQRTSSTCAQTDTRPDLRVLSVVPALPSGFQVVVRNDGPGDVTDPFDVGVAVGGALLPGRATVSRLPAGQNATVRVTGYSCARGTAISALVDTGGDIDESDESDNALSAVC